MTYTQKTIPEFTAGTTINDADYIPYSQGGVTKRIPFGTVKTTIPNLGLIEGEFTNADLSGNTLTINHAKNTRIFWIVVYNPGGIQELVLPTIIDSNNISINFEGTIEAGDWEYKFFYMTAGATATYPDPTYEPAITEGALTPDYTGASANITIDKVYAYRYGKLVFVNMEITSKSTYSIGTTAKVCTLPSVPHASRSFPGAITDTAFYETAYGVIQNTGEVFVNMGNKPKSFVFNFNYEIA